jgi:hypothetical protein
LEVFDRLKRPLDNPLYVKNETKDLVKTMMIDVVEAVVEGVAIEAAGGLLEAFAELI